MATIPYMPLYIADYMADAAHLTTLQHGAYLLLIMTYWQRGKALPDDDEKLARICRLGPREWERQKPQLIEFFQVADGAWFHHRIEGELSRVRAMSLKRQKGGIARAKQMHSTCSPHAKHVLSYSESDTESDINPPIPNGIFPPKSEPEKQPVLKMGPVAIGPPRSKGSRLAPDWFPGTDLQTWTVAHGYPAARIALEVAKFVDYWLAQPSPKGIKLNWDATWRNWIRRAVEETPRSTGGEAENLRRLQAMDEARCSQQQKPALSLIAS